MFTRSERLVIGVVVVLLGAGIWLHSVPRVGPGMEWEEVPAEKPEQIPKEPEPVTIRVHVAGHVASPGVYELEEGARVMDAVLAAGGPTEDGLADALNLAAVVMDGGRVWVPGAGDDGGGHSPAPPAGPTGPPRVNVNRASWTQLQELPGIGPALAQRIIDYRAQHGFFATVDELMEVSGIGPKTMEQLRPLVVLD